MGIQDHESVKSSDLPILKLKVTVITKGGRSYSTEIDTDDPMAVESVVETVLSNAKTKGGYFSLSSPGHRTIMAADSIESVTIKEKTR